MGGAPVARPLVGLDQQPPQGVVVAIDRHPAQAGLDRAGMVAGAQAQHGQACAPR